MIDYSSIILSSLSKSGSYGNNEGIFLNKNNLYFNIVGIIFQSFWQILTILYLPYLFRQFKLLKTSNSDDYSSRIYHWSRVLKS